MDLVLLVLIGIAKILIVFGVDRAIKTEERLQAEENGRKKAEGYVANIQDILKYAKKNKELGIITVNKIERALSETISTCNR